MEETWKIYIVINRLNGIKYVGRTKFDNPNYYGSGELIKNAIKKYGKQNFDKIYVEEVKGYIQSNKKEVEWILKENSLIPNGYNLVAHGDGGFITMKQKKDISKTLKEAWKNPNSIFNSEEYRNNLSRAGKNRVWSEETKKKISDGRWGGNNPAAIKIEVDGVIYETRRECAKHFNISDTAVTKRCKSKNFPTWEIIN